MTGCPFGFARRGGFRTGTGRDRRCTFTGDTLLSSFTGTCNARCGPGASQYGPRVSPVGERSVGVPAWFAPNEDAGLVLVRLVSLEKERIQRGGRGGQDDALNQT